MRSLCEGLPDGACDCDGNIVDACGVCGGDDSSCNIQLSFDNVGDGSMDIIMSSGVDVAGFQFSVTGVNLTGSLEVQQTLMVFLFLQVQQQ